MQINTKYQWADYMSRAQNKPAGKRPERKIDRWSVNYEILQIMRGSKQHG